MNNKCLIVGASGDIGRAVTLNLAKEGYQVGLQYFSNEEGISALMADIPSHQLINTYRADLSSSEGLSSFLRMIGVEWDQIVFAGGYSYVGLFQEMTSDEMDKLYHVHVKTLWMVTNHILPYMIHYKAGNIVVVSSIFGLEGASMEVAYSSVKGAQNSFVKGMAKEAAPSGIRVNAVAPGLIQTKMNAHLTEEEMSFLEDDIPMGRAGKAEEIAETIHFLLSDKSSYITGQVLQINGGWA